MAKKALDELLLNRDDIDLETIDIVSHPLRSLKDGVKFIPTLISGELRLSGILLSSKQIEEFIEKAGTA